MSASIGQIAQQAEQLGAPGLELLNLWLAIWSQLTGRPVVRARWGMLPLPRLTSDGQVVGGFADPQAAAVAVALCGRKDARAADEASAALEQLERDGLTSQGIATEIVAAIIGVVSALVSAGGAAYAAHKKSDDAARAADVAEQNNKAKAELERARIEAEERAAQRSQIIGLVAVVGVAWLLFGGGS